MPWLAGTALFRTRWRSPNSARAGLKGRGIAVAVHLRLAVPAGHPRAPGVLEMVHACLTRRAECLSAFGVVLLVTGGSLPLRRRARAQGAFAGEQHAVVARVAAARQQRVLLMAAYAGGVVLGTLLAAGAQTAGLGKYSVGSRS